ncbi:hypothetical protein A2U01_0069058, partial [Trifolium medium]|nr:hypothetical protein [Trifolium medium]
MSQDPGKINNAEIEQSHNKAETIIQERASSKSPNHESEKQQE